MSRIHLQVPRACGLGEDPPRTYRLAGCHLRATASLPGLEPFEARAVDIPDHIPDQGESESRSIEPQSVEPRCVYGGPGEIGGARRRVECWWSGEGYRLEIAGAGAFAVAAGGTDLRCLQVDSRATRGELVEVLLGPVLLLALAQRGIFCLHAGAVAAGARAVAFAGASGAGKSTLAAALARRPPFRRLADDLLPVALEAGGAVALPHFPQLKLPAAEQPAGEDERLELAAVYLLAAEAKGGADAGLAQVASCDLAGRRGALALVAQTAAARLFAPPLLAAHLSFCGDLAARIPVRRLAYPRRAEALPRVAEEIRRELEVGWQ